MKKITLFTLFFAGIFSFANAQTDKGSIIAGGDISFDFGKDKAKSNGTTVEFGKTTTVEFSPLAGYFFMDRLAGGLEFNINSTTFKEDGTGDKDVFTVIAVGPFVKYYHETGLFGMGSVGFGSIKDKTITGSVTNEGTSGIFQWRLGAGYAAFLNDHVSVEPMLSYGALIIKDKDANPEVKDISNRLRISVAFNIFLDF
jgi:outer membrane protein